MNRSELFSNLALKNKVLDIETVEEATRVLLQAITTALNEGRRVEVRGFGNFNLHMRKPRTHRNPKTGQTFKLPERPVIRFKPGKQLKESVR